MARIQKETTVSEEIQIFAIVPRMKFVRYTCFVLTEEGTWIDQPGYASLTF